ncbi:MAG: hypothetical protein PGN13_14065 [Patulibacter minatonensis]
MEALVEGIVAASERFAQLLLADPAKWTPERLESFAAQDLAWPSGRLFGLISTDGAG